MAAKDRLDARHDYEVNLKAEMEITELHAKLDELIAERWRELLAIPERQIAALERIERGVTEDEAERSRWPFAPPRGATS